MTKYQSVRCAWRRACLLLLLLPAALLLPTGHALPLLSLQHGQAYQVQVAAQQQRVSGGVGNEQIGTSRKLTQRVDHFDRQNDAVFEQRYFINDTFWDPESGGPVFLCVGGEGPPLDESVLVASVHCNDMVELGARRGALLLALEHRYYGESQPFDDFSTQNLRYLSSQQALGDLVLFHRHMSDTFNLTRQNRWVTWGGSYPGMMAAFARQLHPSLFYAAVSSSSPLRVQLDFPQYNEVVARSMSSPIVGGSEECLDIIRKGHEQVAQLLATKHGRRRLSGLFNICNASALEDEENVRVFAGDGVVYLPVQSNDPSCTDPNCNIEAICKTLLQVEGQPIEALATLSDSQHKGVCMPVSLREAVGRLQNVRNPERTWIYQTCTEFGFYQSCEKDTTCPYVHGIHTLEQDLQLCEAAFGIKPEAVAAQVAYTQSYYGADFPSATRILFANGFIDPWSALGVSHSSSPSEPTLLVDGASHHFWTHPSLPTDQPQVQEARRIIWYQLDTWLSEDPEVL